MTFFCEFEMGSEQSSLKEGSEIETSLDVPHSISDITAEWLERSLKHNQIIPSEVTISSLRIDQLGCEDGGGVSGASIVRLLLTYDSPQSSGLPSSMICKFTRGVRRDLSFKSRILFDLVYGDEADWARREMHFFSNIAPQLEDTRFRFPKAYFSQIMDNNKRGTLEKYFSNIPHTIRSIIIMEDLQSWEGSLLGTRLSKEKVALCMENLAALHASFWGKCEELETNGVQLSTYEVSSRGGRYSNMGSFLQRRYINSSALLRKKVDRFLNGIEATHPATKLSESSILPDWLTVPPSEDGTVSPFKDPLVREMLYVFAERLPRYYEEGAKYVLEIKPPQTILHGDFHPGNHLFGNIDNKENVVALDFQFTGLGIVAIDLVYFFETSYPVTNYSEIQAILKIYHDALIGNGVIDYQFDELCFEFEVFLINRMICGVPLSDRFSLDDIIRQNAEFFGPGKSDMIDFLVKSGNFGRRYILMAASLYTHNKDAFMTLG